jgi:hypothetical protein
MRIICWLIELYYVYRYAALIRGHAFIERADGVLVCERCGEVSE